MSVEHPPHKPQTTLASGHLMSKDPVTGKVELQSTAQTSELCEQFEATRQRLGDLKTWPVASALIPAPQPCIVVRSISTACAVAVLDSRIPNGAAIASAVAVATIRTLVLDFIPSLPDCHDLRIRHGVLLRLVAHQQVEHVYRTSDSDSDGGREGLISEHAQFWIDIDTRDDATIGETE